jgi:radical SAM superfamily enzyme YgiQ (UPF0313 family)
MEFCDDQFILSKEWIFDFCDQYKRKINLPFSCLSSARQLTSEIVEALKKAGCSSVNFAIESGVERLRKEVYNKPISDSDIYSAAEILRFHKIPFQTFNMVGLPEETPEDIYQTIRINQEIKVTYPWCSIVQPYPGTKLAEHMRKQGVDLPSGFSPTFFQETAIQDPERKRLILNAQRLFGLMVTSEASFDTFVRFAQNPPLGMDKLYMPVFYWYYGRSLRARHKMPYLSLLRYWLYSLQG